MLNLGKKQKSRYCEVNSRLHMETAEFI